MALPSPEEVAQMTPMMGQFFQLKRRVEDAIVFFRMGDFYEIFGDDAEDVAPKLDLVLTAREKGNQTKIPFCGVPHHSARNYWLKLLQMGYKVAIAEQVEDPTAAKGLVRRDIVRIYTPGCLDDVEALQSEKPNYVMTICENPRNNQISMVIADVSTGELRAGTLATQDDILRQVQKFRPAEIITRKFFRDTLEQRLNSYTKENHTVFGNIPEAILRDTEDQQRLIATIFGNAKIESPHLMATLAGFLVYLQQLNASASAFVSIRPICDPATMSLGEVATRDLEIFETLRRRSREGSLFWEINRTATPMGARLLHHSLRSPLLQPESIQDRQLGVAFFIGQRATMTDAQLALKGLPDLERLFARTLSGRSNPNEVFRLRIGLEKALAVGKALNLTPTALTKSTLNTIPQTLAAAAKPLRMLQERLAAEPGQLGTNLDCIRTGFDASFDQLRDDALHGEEKIKQYENSLREQTKINSLKIKSHKTYGLLIEVTKSNLAKIPDDFIRRQTMVNNERFVTLELQELDEKLSQAREQAFQRESEIFQQVLTDLQPFRDQIGAVAAAIAYTDLILGFAIKAVESDYCLPELCTDGGIQLKASRHPVIESHVGRHDFTPNDISISEERSVVITGPNMAGKSTIMRQLAITAILHQIGSFVPATEARLPIFDNVFTRIGASDDLAQGKSTFMVEMTEASEILREATNKSLIILDEVGRGTSTEDGMAIALAILEDLTCRVAGYCLFATHFHELIPVAKDLGGIKLLQTEVKEGTDIKFTHRIVPGAASHSFGVEVAKIAGIPAPVINKARTYLTDTLTKHPKPENRVYREPRNSITATPSEGEIFSPLGNHQAIIAKLESININRTTPMQALAQIEKLQSMLTQKCQSDIFSLQ